MPRRILTSDVNTGSTAYIDWMINNSIAKNLWEFKTNFFLDDTIDYHEGYNNTTGSYYNRVGKLSDDQPLLTADDDSQSVITKKGSNCSFWIADDIKSNGTGRLQCPVDQRSEWAIEFWFKIDLLGVAPQSTKFILQVGLFSFVIAPLSSSSNTNYKLGVLATRPQAYSPQGTGSRYADSNKDWIAYTSYTPHLNNWNHMILKYTNVGNGTNLELEFQRLDCYLNGSNIGHKYLSDMKARSITVWVSGSSSRPVFATIPYSDYGSQPFSQSPGSSLQFAPVNAIDFWGESYTQSVPPRTEPSYLPTMQLANLAYYRDYQLGLGLDDGYHYSLHSQ